MDIKKNKKMVQIYEYIMNEISSHEKIMEYLKNSKYYQIHQFTFDYIFDEATKQLEIYDITAKESVKSVLDGFNATIMAYGQTGTGKTFTMEGELPNSEGITFLAIKDLFKEINKNNEKNISFDIKISFLQIYNEQILDLLNSKSQNKNLSIREDKLKGVFVENLTEISVNNQDEALELLVKGSNIRANATTKLNIKSSRSHAIFIIHILKKSNGNYSQHSKLNFVDLAGSERIRVTGATGARLEECKSINQSLAQLANVIFALSKKKINHVPYRNNKLTRLLEDSLGGNCRTTLIATVSPHLDSFSESVK